MYKEQIQKRLEQALATYVAMPTVPTNIAACTSAVNYLANQLQHIGMFTQIGGPMHPWVVATSTKRALLKQHVKVLFTIHFDITTPSDESQLTLKSTPTKLVGRGAYDMKFAAACAVEMVRDLAAEGTLADHDIGILITTDEEKGGYDGALEFLQEGWRCELAVVPDGGGNWKLEGRAKGISYAYLHASGKSAHSSRPWEGDNPIYKIGGVAHEIGAYFANYGKDDVTVSVNSIQTNGGDVMNTTRIPDWAKAGVSVRAFTNAETDAAFAVIDQIAKKHDLTIERTLNDSEVHLQLENPLVQEFLTTMQEVHGKQIEIVDALGASDARHFAGYNIPSVVLYPEGAGLHTSEEWLLRSDLYKFYDLIKRFVTKTARQPQAVANFAEQLTASAKR